MTKSSTTSSVRTLVPDEDVLKARETRPRTAKVYCHRAESWPEDAEIVERVPVKSCTARGPAVELVLDRGREKRSQLVFTRVKGGREAIFWQTPRTNAKARPGVRTPRARASGFDSLQIVVDSAERYPYRFSSQRAETQRGKLACGDYGVRQDDALVAVVERKSLEDLARSLVDGRMAGQLAELATVGRAAGPAARPGRELTWRSPTSSVTATAPCPGSAGPPGRRPP